MLGFALPVMASQQEIAAMGKSKNAIKDHGVSWQKHAQQNTIGKDHLPVVQEFDKAEAFKQKAMLDDPNTGPLIAECLTMVLKKMDYSIVDDLEYVLVLIDEILEYNRKYAQLFRDLTQVNIFKNVLDLMSWEKRFASTGSHVLGILFYPGIGNGHAIIDNKLDDLVEFCMLELDPANLKTESARKMIDMLSCFIVLLRQCDIREKMNEQFRLHNHFSQLLEKAHEIGDVQLLYQVSSAFCECQFVTIILWMHVRACFETSSYAPGFCIMPISTSFVLFAAPSPSFWRIFLPLG